MRMMQVVINSEINVLLARIIVRAIVGDAPQLLNVLTRSQRLTDEANTIYVQKVLGKRLSISVYEGSRGDKCGYRTSTY